MDRIRVTGRPWRSWTAIAFVLLTLAAIQACDSGKHTGPTTNSSVQLRLKQASGAELQAGCIGVYSVTGPGVNIQNAALPASGQITFQGQIGQTYQISVSVTCGQALRVKLAQGGTQTGTGQITLGAGNNELTITLTFTQVSGVSCVPNPVDSGKDSICTCQFQSAGAPTVTWSSNVVPINSTQARFNGTATQDVTCSVNGVANGKTTVVVGGGSGSIQIFNDVPPLQQQRRGFASHLNEFFPSIFARVDGSGGAQVDPGHSITVSASPGSHQVDASCNSGFDGFETQQVQVNSGQTSQVHFDGGDVCD
jgi:hypothetical protein